MDLSALEQQQQQQHRKPTYGQLWRANKAPTEIEYNSEKTDKIILDKSWANHFQGIKNGDR